MATAGRTYVVRDADTGTEPGQVFQVYAYTLQGLTTALEDARLRSFRVSLRRSPALGGHQRLPGLCHPVSRPAP
jgi:hypothetical protein